MLFFFRQSENDLRLNIFCNSALKMDNHFEVSTV